MPRPSSFSASDDADIVSMRAAGHGWKAIGGRLHRGHNTVRDHAYRLGLAVRAPVSGRMPHGAAALLHAQVTAARGPQPHQLDSHAPMAAFHPVSWGAIWAGHHWVP
jgi:hypothetical protein